MDLCDDYWVRLLQPRVAYEAEIELVLRLFLDLPEVVFVDAGANKGYWSVFVGSYWEDASRVIAIEASIDTYNELVENAVLNSHAFRCMNAAVSSVAGKVGTITTIGNDHAGARLSDHPTVAENSRGRPVGTTTLDVIASSFPARASFFVKLDVEGVEVAAMEGAKEMLESRPVLIAYEDHGADVTCATTAFALARGLHVYYIFPDARVVQVRDTETLRAIKVNRYTGYNLFAVQPDSDFERRLQGVAG